jgi:16S rRNA (cytosine967-C5)-methyltransferase
MAPGEPWNLNSEELAEWRPAQLLAERICEYGIDQKAWELAPAIREDFPPHFISEWESSFGTEVMMQLIQELSVSAPLGLRASHRVGAKELLDRLTSQEKLGTPSQLSKLTPLGIRLDGYAPVLKTDSYQKGDFEIQDEGSQLMSVFAVWPEVYGHFLQLHPGKISHLDCPPLPKNPAGWSIVDACAGAGGKSLAIGDALRGKGRVYSYDTSERKLQALRRRATRAGLTNIQTVSLPEGNEAEILDRFSKTADIVLVDAPCTGWGVLRRNPDIKWRQTKDTLQKMPQIQMRLLSLYSSLVKPGGKLVYGVCTFRRDETQDIVQQFVQTHAEFQAQQGGYLGPGPCDGFFMQSFVRGT